ncbi:MULTISPECIES: porin [unclassified Paraburkholderia]|uniref:Outer membrane protein (Porin) n=1 Tax=Paraburkholderia phenazinium TaxID=60549 RepID=A0A1N6JYU3_9BURK|nr:Outer membrane protein (porin) [Paraburkholderia phenazinium]
MKRYKEAGFVLAGMTAMLATGTVFAQSSVTLYGIVDTGVGYLSSQAPSTGATKGGQSVVKLVEGVWGGERFGFKGVEDLGGGTRAIFQLEEGFNADTGALSKAGLMFSRASWVGLTNDTYGTFTAGRQYTPYYNMLAQYGPTPWLTGAFGAHPGDLDALDTDYRVNNALVYTSPSFAGLKISGMYALGGVAGAFNSGASWSVGAQYVAGGAGIGVGFARFDNATSGGGAWSSSSTAYSGTGEQGESSITNGYQNAAAQQRFAVTGGYQFNPQWDVSASYSNVQYIVGPNSGFSTTAIFNTGGAVLHYRPVVSWDLAVGYSYTRATQANGVQDAASYQQINLTELYNLSKRTRIYVLEAFQRANGQTIDNGKVVTATAAIAEQSAASSRSQFGATIGINHQF